MVGMTVALFGVLGCSHPDPFYLPGYASDQAYATKTDLPAIIIRDPTSGKVTDAIVNAGSGAGQSAGSVETLAAGTKIKIEKVVRPYDVDQGTLVRVTAKVASGPYEGAKANLSRVSVIIKGPDGRPSDMEPNQEYLSKLDE
jgi:hypothetical protein